MKRIVLLLLASLPMLVQAQNVSWKFFDRYTKAEGFTSVQLERKMLRMMRRDGDNLIVTLRVKVSGSWRSTRGTAVSSSPMPRPLRPLRTTVSIW